MIQLFRAFIDEVAHRGVKGLAELIAPQLGKAVDFFQGVRERYAERNALREQKAEAEKIARMSAEQIVADIREAVEKAFPDRPQLREEVSLYLSLAPTAVQRTLRRKDDPKGLSAPADFALDSPEKVAALFPAAVPTLRPGDPVPGREEKYRLVAPVGGGGFGEVWKVADRMRPGHFTAIKVFPDPKTPLDVIRHEYRQALRLNDPVAGWPAGVVPVVDAELKGDRPWLMYEFVGGGTLADLIVRWQALDVTERTRRALRAMRSLAGTCARLHAMTPALVHRDLKPANVLRDEGGERLRITDLGLGGAAVQYELATETQGYRSVSGRLPSLLFGSYSLNYASPEQRKGNPPDPRDDVHALGVIAFQMLTGKLDAAPGTDAAEELQELGVPAEVIRVVQACTATDPHRRPRDAAALADALAKLAPELEPGAADEPRDASPPVLPRQPEHSRWRVPVIAGVGLLVAAVALVAYFGLAGKPSNGGPSGGAPGAIAVLPHNGVEPPERSEPKIPPPAEKPQGAAKPKEWQTKWRALKPGTKAGEEVTLPLGESGASMTFCWCPPGAYKRGCKDYPEERPVRDVTISNGFWLAKYETTQAQWKELGSKNESRFQGDTRPVENVSHDQAVAFAGELKRLTGQAARLPTEAEWEYAGRAATPAGQKYWSGDAEKDLARVGWYDQNGGDTTHPVGEKKQPNPWGLHDMHGNVWEWCADWYDEGYYKESKDSPAVDPECKIGEQKHRVLRGGSWASFAIRCRAANRFRREPGYRNDSREPSYSKDSYGFRLLLPAN